MANKGTPDASMRAAPAAKTQSKAAREARSKSAAKVRNKPAMSRPVAYGSAPDFQAVRLPDCLPDFGSGPTEAAPVPLRRLARHPDLKPSHPGTLLRAILQATGRSKTEIARLLGVSRPTLHELLAETAAVTPNLALRLGRMFGNGPEPWLRMQAAHDVWTVGRAIAGELAEIPVLAAAE